MKFGLHGKTMENLRNKINVRLVNNKKKIEVHTKTNLCVTKKYLIITWWQKQQQKTKLHYLGENKNIF